jgi:small subunit ribosomal protein S9
MTEITKTKYIETVGRRKTSVARVRITESAKNSITINGKDIDAYFATAEQKRDAASPIVETNYPAKFKVTVLVKGGGIS